MSRGKKARNLEEWKDYILENVIVNQNNCWEFKLRINKSGYGHVYVGGKNGKNELVHRLIYKVLIKDISSNVCVCHKCDNKLCCNPDHLFLGTHKDNAIDKKNKGRCFISYGEKSGRHKLTTEQVLKIRNDKRKLLDIANDYNVSKSTISYIKNRKSRKYE